MLQNQPREDKIVSGLEKVKLEDINPGEVTLKTEYSSINYKDAGCNRGWKDTQNFSTYRWS